MTDEVTKAEQTIGFLQEKQAAAIKRGHDLQEERAATALAAHTGDQGARAKLDALNLESAQHASELQSIGEALAAATNKLASARAAELRRQERADALRLRKAAKKFSDAGHRLDAVLADLPAAAQAVAAALNGVHQAGSPSPKAISPRLPVGRSSSASPLTASRPTPGSGISWYSPACCSPRTSRTRRSAC